MSIIYWYWVIGILEIIIIFLILFGLFRIKRIERYWLKGLIFGSIPALILATLTIISILTNAITGKINGEADLSVVVGGIYTLYTTPFSILGVIIGIIFDTKKLKKSK